MTLPMTLTSIVFFLPIASDRFPKPSAPKNNPHINIHRLNSGVSGVDNFSGQSNFIIEDIGNDSVNQAESGDIKILV